MTLRLALVIDGNAEDGKAALEEAKAGVTALGQAAEGANRKTTTAGKAVAATTADAGKAAKLSGLQLQNLQFQLQDIAQGIGTGQLGFRLLLQQGSQIVQMFGPGVGVGAALRQVGAGILSFVTNPLNIALLGFSALTGAATYFFSEVVSGGRSADDVLEQHEALIGRIRDAWPEATKGVRDYGRESIDVLTVLTKQQIAELRSQVGGLANDFLDATEELQVGIVDGLGATNVLELAERFRPAETAIERLRAQAREGRPDIQGFRRDIADLANLDPESQAVQAIAAELLAMTKDADKVARALEAAEGAILQTGAAARGEVQAVADFGDALRALAGIAPARISDQARAAEELNKALANASGVEERQVAFEAYRQTVARINAEEATRAAAEPARTTASRQRTTALAGERVATQALADAEKAFADQLDVVRGVAGDVFTTIANGARQGTSALEIALGVANRLADAFVRAGSNAFAEAFFGARGTAATGLLGGLVPNPSVSASVGVYHAGGDVGDATPRHRLVDAAAFAGAPRFHNGLQPGERVGIFEDGETILPRGQRAGGVVNNVFNIETPNPRAFAESRASVARAAGRLMTRAGRHG